MRQGTATTTMPHRLRRRNAEMTTTQMTHNHKHQTAHSHRDHSPHPGSPAPHNQASSLASGHVHAGHDHAGMVADFRRRFWIALILTVPILLLSPAGGHGLGLIGAVTFPGSHPLLLALSSAVYFYGGWPFLTGLFNELRQRQPGMMTLISLAISVAYFYSAAVVLGLSGTVLFWELATLIDIMLLGHWIEMKSVMGASGALKALVELLPATAHRLAADGTQEEVAVSNLQPGDRVLVRPGERVPTDGRISEGTTSLDESMLTGESKPVTRGPGETAIGGSVNGEGAITVQVAKTGKDTYLSQVIEMVSRAQASRSRTQDLANRAALWLTFIAIGAGLFTLAVWLLSDRGFAFAIERMVTVMVIACPHALGLAVPLVVAVSTTLAARSGLLIRDRAAFERGRELGAVVFDKTGTLTEGRFGVTDVVPLADADDREVLSLPLPSSLSPSTRSRAASCSAPRSFRSRSNGWPSSATSPARVRWLGSATMRSRWSAQAILPSKASNTATGSPA